MWSDFFFKKKGGGERKRWDLRIKALELFEEAGQTNFNVPVLDFSISSVVPCGIHGLSDVAPPSEWCFSVVLRL